MGLRIDPNLFAPAAALLAGLWSRTLRYFPEGLDECEGIRARGERLIVALWHDELFPTIYFHRHQGLVAMVSQSRDGEFLARAMARFGYRLARGSSRRGGASALVAARREMREQGSVVVFTVDGPRGPRHKVKEGAVYLAAKTGAYLVPMRVFMSRSFVFRRAWDSFQLPWPWAGCRMVYGKPYRVAAKQSPESLQAECVRLEEILNSMR